MQYVKKIRRAKGINQGDLADSLGIPRSSISTAENGNKSINIPLSRFIKICEYLEIDWDDFSDTKKGGTDEALIQFEKLRASAKKFHEDIMKTCLANSGVWTGE